MLRGACAAIVILGVLGCSSGGGGTSTSLAAPGATGPTTPSPVSVSTIAQGSMSGHLTAQGGREFLVIRDDAAWQTLWSAHTSNVFPAPAQPAVDFRRESVIAVFQGQQPSGGYATEVVAVEQLGSAWTVRVAETAPAPGAITPSVITTPFHFVRSPAAPAQVDFLLDTTGAALAGAHGTFYDDALGPRVRLDSGGQRAVLNPDVIRQAGGVDGSTLSLWGDLTSAGIDLDRVVLDSFAASGTMTNGLFQPLGETNTYTLTGAALQNVVGARKDAVLFITGQASQLTGQVDVTSARVQRMYRYSVMGGMMGWRETFDIDIETGAYRYFQDALAQPQQPATTRKGRLDSATLGSLQQALSLADLPSQPYDFPRPFIVMDVPTTLVSLADLSLTSTSRIVGGSQPPPEVNALNTETRQVIQTILQSP